MISTNNNFIVNSNSTFQNTSVEKTYPDQIDKDALLFTLTQKYIQTLHPSKQQMGNSLRQLLLETLMDAWEKKTLVDSKEFVDAFRMILELNSDNDTTCEFQGFKVLQALCKNKHYLDLTVQDLLESTAPSQLKKPCPSLIKNVVPALEKCLTLISSTYINTFCSKIHSITHNVIPHSQETFELMLSLKKFNRHIRKQTASFLAEMSSMKGMSTPCLKNKCFQLTFLSQALTKYSQKLINQSEVCLKQIDVSKFQASMGIKAIEMASGKLQDASAFREQILKRIEVLPEGGFDIFDITEVSIKPSPKVTINPSSGKVFFGKFFEELDKIKTQTCEQSIFDQVQESEYKELQAQTNQFKNSFLSSINALTFYLKHLADLESFTNEVVSLDALWLELIESEARQPSKQTQQAPKRKNTFKSKHDKKKPIGKTEPKVATEIQKTEGLVVKSETFLSQSQKQIGVIQDHFNTHPLFTLLTQGDITLANHLSKDHLHHLNQLFSGFDMLQNSLSKPESIPALIPGLILDMSVVLEHCTTLHFWEEFNSLPRSHSLTNNLSHTLFWGKLKEFNKLKLAKFDKGNIWARYPQTSSLNYRRGQVPSALAVVLKSVNGRIKSVDDRKKILNEVRQLMIDCLSLQEVILGVKSPTPWRAFLKPSTEAIDSSTQPTPNPSIDALIQTLSSSGSVQSNEAASHLVRFKANLKLTENCHPKYQALIYKNLLNISIVFEQILQEKCLDEGHDLIISHELSDFIDALSSPIPEEKTVLSFSMGTALKYPGFYPAHPLAKKLFLLENRALQYNEVEDGFGIPNDKLNTFFDTCLPFFEKGIECVASLVKKNLEA
jgi:hypothetical protein